VDWQWRIRTVKRGSLITTQLDANLSNCSSWVKWSARNLNLVPLIEYVPSHFDLVKTGDSDSDLGNALLQVKMLRLRLHTQIWLISKLIYMSACNPWRIIFCSIDVVMDFCVFYDGCSICVIPIILYFHFLCVMMFLIVAISLVGVVFHLPSLISTFSVTRIFLIHVNVLLYIYWSPLHPENRDWTTASILLC
jgi:hypothetical protein